MTDRFQVEVEPVKRDGREGRSSQKYRYERIYVADIDVDEVDVGKARLTRHGSEMVKWKYPHKPTVAITPGGVYGREEDDRREQQQQAYFALSILSSHGYVGKFRKR